MANDANDVIKRLFQRFFRDELPGLSPADRMAFEAEFEERYDQLLDSSASEVPTSFADLVGFGPGPLKAFDALEVPLLRNDFDKSVIPPQLHASAELYYIYQMERMKIFAVVGVLRRLFQNGQIRIQRGPGARGLYILEKWTADPLPQARPLHRLSPRLQLRPRAGAAGRCGEPQLPLPAGRLHVGDVAVLPRPDHRPGDPRIDRDQRPALRLARHGAAGRDGPSLPAGPGELWQHPRADPRGRAVPAAGLRAVRRARHQEGLRRQHPLGRDRGGVEPLPRRRGRHVAARQDGRNPGGASCSTSPRTTSAPRSTR